MVRIVRDDSDSILIRSYDATTTYVLDIPSGFPESRQAVQHNFMVFRQAHISEYGTAEGYGYYPSDSLDEDNAIFHNNSAGAPRDLWYRQTQYRDIRPNGDDAYHNVYVVTLYHNDTLDEDQVYEGFVSTQLMYRVDTESSFPLADTFDESNIRGASASDRTFMGGIEYDWDSTTGDLNNRRVLTTET